MAAQKRQPDHLEPLLRGAIADMREKHCHVRDCEVKLNVFRDGFALNNTGGEIVIGKFGAEATVVVRIELRPYGARDVDPNAEGRLEAFQFAAMAVDAAHYYEQWWAEKTRADRAERELERVMRVCDVAEMGQKKRTLDAEFERGVAPDRCIR